MSSVRTWLHGAICAVGWRRGRLRDVGPAWSNHHRRASAQRVISSVVVSMRLRWGSRTRDEPGSLPAFRDGKAVRQLPKSADQPEEDTQTDESEPQGRRGGLREKEQENPGDDEQCPQTVLRSRSTEPSLRLVLVPHSRRTPPSSKPAGGLVLRMFLRPLESHMFGYATETEHRLAFTCRDSWTKGCQSVGTRDPRGRVIDFHGRYAKTVVPNMTKSRVLARRRATTTIMAPASNLGHPRIGREFPPARPCAPIVSGPLRTVACIVRQRYPLRVDGTVSTMDSRPNSPPSSSPARIHRGLSPPSVGERGVTNIGGVPQ